MPPTASINHYLLICIKPIENHYASEPAQQIRPRSFSIIPCKTIQAYEACFEHFNLFKVKVSRTKWTSSLVKDINAIHLVFSQIVQVTGK